VVQQRQVLSIHLRVFLHLNACNLSNEELGNDLSWRRFIRRCVDLSRLKKWRIMEW
jgi:hypothetical protein